MPPVGHYDFDVVVGVLKTRRY